MPVLCLDAGVCRLVEQVRERHRPGLAGGRAVDEQREQEHRVPARTDESERPAEVGDGRDGQRERIAADNTVIITTSGMLSGGFATMILADFGADVVTVEHPERGDVPNPQARARFTADGGDGPA